MKLKFETVKEWFTPIQACHYLFEDAGNYDEATLLKEIAILVNNYKLVASIKNYTFQSKLSEEENNQTHQAMIEVFNNQNSTPLPIIHNFIMAEWLQHVVVDNTQHSFLAPDIYDFDKQFEENGFSTDSPWGFSQRFSVNNTSSAFHVIATSFEIGFMRENLDLFILQQTTKSKSTTELKPRERETMIKIIHALAKNGYAYPARSSITEMIQDFERNGNGVSEKTLKKYLDEADAL